MYLLPQELIPEFFCLPEMFTNMNGYKVKHNRDSILDSPCLTVGATLNLPVL